MATKLLRIEGPMNLDLALAMARRGTVATPEQREEAVQYLKNWAPMPGDDITSASRTLIKICLALDAETASMKFNDITVTATRDSSTQSLVAKYMADMDAKAAAWKASPEGQRAAAEAAERLRKDQATIDEYMAKLPTLDFSDYEMPLRWCAGIANATDHVGVKLPYKQIVDTFEKHGFKRGAYTGADFQHTREIEARYIIGQAMQGLMLSGIHAMHGMVVVFFERWCEKYA